MAQVGVSVRDGPFMKGAESQGHGGFPRWVMWDAPFKDSFCGTIETCWTVQDIPYGMTPRHRLLMDAWEARIAFKLSPSNKTVYI